MVQSQQIHQRSGHKVRSTNADIVVSEMFEIRYTPYSIRG